MDSNPTGDVLDNLQAHDSSPVNGANSATSDFSRRSSIQVDDTQDIIRTDGFPNTLDGDKDDSTEGMRELSAPTNGTGHVAETPTIDVRAAQTDMSLGPRPKKKKPIDPPPTGSDTLALMPVHRSQLVASVQRARLRLADYDPSTTASMRSLTKRDLEQFTVELRLRVMARKGTRVDEIFKRGEKFIEGWFSFVPFLAIWEPGARDCSDVLMTFCKILLKQTVRGSTMLFEKILATLRYVGVVLQDEIAATKKENLTAVQVTEIVNAMIILLIELCADLVQFLRSSGTGSESLSMLSLRLSTFTNLWTTLRNNFKLEIWQLEVGRGGTGQNAIAIETLRAWLASQQVSARPSLQQPTPPPFEDIPLEWLRSLISKFTRSEDNMLVMTGEAGVGKSGLMASIVDFLKLSTTISTPVLTFHVEPSSRSERSELNLVKFLLLQLFDRSIGNIAFYERLCDVYIEVERNKVANPEVLLWSLFTEQVSKEAGEMFIVVDGLDKIEGRASTAMKVRGILYDICIRVHRIKAVILSQPIFIDYPPGCQHFHIDQRDIYTDLHLFLERRIRHSSKLQFLTRREVDEILKRFVSRTLSTFLEVTLFVGWLELHRSFDDILNSLRDIPKTLDELIDHLILRIDFKDHQTQAVLSWLLVAEKPLTAHELIIFLGPGMSLPPDFADKEALYLQNLCPSLLEMRGLNIRFKHIKIRERMLDLASKWKISMRLTDAHATALLACIAYIKQHIGRDSDNVPVWDGLEDTFDKKLREVFKKDSVFEYSIRYYIIHFQRSELSVDQLIKRLGDYFIDSVELVIYEQFCWRNLAYGDALESLHKNALRLRITLLGKFSRSLVQTLISLARYQLDAGSDDMAMTYIGEAWDVSQNLGTALEPISYVLAIKYLEVYQNQVASGGDSISVGIIERILQYLWTNDERIHGSDHEITLSHAEMLKAIYNQQGKYQQVVTVLQRLYETFAKKKGQFDVRAIKYADELIRWLTQLGQYGEVKQLCEDILLSMSNVIARSDERRVKIVLRLVEYYEVSGQRSMALERLKQEWKPLLDEATSSTSGPVVVLVALLRITVRLCINAALTGAHEETDNVAQKTWVIVEPRMTESQDIMMQLRLLSETCIQSGRHKTALLILEKLSIFYMKDVPRHFLEAVKVALALVLCYQKLGKSPSEVEDVYRRIFDVFITLQLRDSACITLALELVNYYQAQQRMMDAMEVCRSVLHLFWAPILDVDSTEPYLPETERTQSLELGFRFADLTAAIDPRSQAVKVYHFIWRACQKSLQITDIDLFKAAKKLSASFEVVLMQREAVDLWRAFRTLCIAQLGSLHSLVRRVTEELVSLYVRYDFAESEEVLLEIIRVGGETQEMYCRQPTLNAIISLLKLYEKKQQLESAQRWYTELWTALKYYRQAANVDGSIILEVFENYRKFLKLTEDELTIIRVARELRAICQTDYGNLSLFYMRATFELAVLLETNKTLYREAVSLFEEVISIKVDTSDDKAEMLKITQDARLKLALLYSRYPEYADKAEGILVKAWRIALRSNGAIHASTMNSFTEIMAFYGRREPDQGTRPALELLDAYIVAILIEVKEERTLFNMALYIVSFYIKFKSILACRSIMDDIRGEYLGLGGDIVHKYRFGSSGGAYLDRRCFVFILAIEEHLRGGPVETLYPTIIGTLFTEVALYEGWAKINRSSQPLQARLSAGIRLLNFLEEKNRPLEVRTLRGELWKLFQDSFGSLVDKPGMVRQLFDILIAEFGKGFTSITVVRALGEACMDLWLGSAFNGCLDLLRWIRSYYVPYTTLDHQELIRIGFRLSSIVSGAGTNPGDLDTSVSREIRNLVFDIILIMFRLDDQEAMDFTGLKPEEINILIEVLLAQNDMDALEKFFQALWDSRTYRDWSPKITIGFGKRLCWAKYENKHKEAALELIEDICYNLQDTNGDDDPWTIDCKNLQAQMMGSSGSYDRALVLNGTTLERLLKSTRQQGEIPKSVANEITQQLRQLKALYYLAGNWGSLGQDRYQVITNEAAKQLANTEHQKEAAELADVSKWTHASKQGGGINVFAAGSDNKEIGEAQDLVHWTRPDDWRLPEDVMSDVAYTNGTSQGSGQYRIEG